MAKTKQAQTNIFLRQKVKWTEEGKNMEIHKKGKIEKSIIKDATKEMKDKMKKNGQKEDDKWWAKNNSTKEEKQEEAEATRQNRHKHRKEHGKIINYYWQEKVKTNEISDKRGE